MAGFNDITVTGTIRFPQAGGFLLLCNPEAVTPEIRDEISRVWRAAFAGEKCKWHRWPIRDGNMENWDNFEGCLFFHILTYEGTFTKKGSSFGEWSTQDLKAIDSTQATATFKAYPRQRRNEKLLYLEAESVVILDTDPLTIPFAKEPRTPFEEFLTDEDVL